MTESEKLRLRDLIEYIRVLPPAGHYTLNGAEIELLIKFWETKA